MSNEFCLSFVNKTDDTDVLFFRDINELNHFLEEQAEDEVREYNDLSINGKKVLYPERYQQRNFIEQVKTLVSAIH